MAHVSATFHDENLWNFQSFEGMGGATMASVTVTRRRVVLPLVATVVAAVVVVAFVAWLRAGPRAASDRPLPAAGTDVSTVAAAYLDAAVHQDCAFTSALTVHRQGHTFAWCTSPTMTAYRSVGTPVLLPKEQAGRDLQCVPFEMTTTDSADGSLRAGSGPWSLCFTETAEGWRVFDQGHV